MCTRKIYETITIEVCVASIYKYILFFTLLFDVLLFDRYVGLMLLKGFKNEARNTQDRIMLFHSYRNKEYNYVLFWRLCVLIKWIQFIRPKGKHNLYANKTSLQVEFIA